MSKRGRHIGKSQKDRENYIKDIKNVDYNSTTNDKPLKFSDSDKSEEDLSNSTENKRRPLDTTQQIKEHLAKNWIGYVIGFFIFISSLFIFNFNSDIGTLNGKVGEIKDTVNRIDNNYEKISQTSHSQDLKIQKNALKIEQLEKSTDKLSVKLEKNNSPETNTISKNK